ncbi:MAG: hypothetical protein SWI22_14340 [Pseudomonadota bacterium]|nr:hypothetical protein [Pseudomonadota bacterium]
MFLRLVGVVAILSLGACASPYVAKPYDRASANVQSIAVLDDSLPEKAIAYEVASTGSSFGLIGALVDAGIQGSRQEAVNAALNGVSFDAEQIMEARLASALSREGYTVAVMDNGVRPKREVLATYPAAPTEADAYLDIVVTQYGYLSPGAGQPFRPHASAVVKLVSVADGSTVLAENVVAYNPMGAPQGIVTITPNGDYVFRNRGELLADPQRLADGITDALNQVADTAAKLLR